MTDKRRWAVYVDGFNFYYAVRNRLPEDQLYLGWCDFRALAAKIIATRGTISRIKYFTAPVGSFGKPNGDAGRQQGWLRAVNTISGIEVIEGFYNGDFSDDPSGRAKKRAEKETDVNIAIQMVLDAAKQVYDHAILVSGDYDQMATVRAVTMEFPGKRIEVWLPPGQAKGEWTQFDAFPNVSVNALTPEMLSVTRLADGLVDRDGAVPQPSEWRKPTVPPRK